MAPVSRIVCRNLIALMVLFVIGSVVGCASAPPDPSDMLKNRLASDDVTQRILGLTELREGRGGPEDTLPIVYESLRHPDQRIRVLAAQALEKWEPRPPQAIEELLKAHKAEQENSVRLTIQEIVTRMQKPGPPEGATVRPR